MRSKDAIATIVPDREAIRKGILEFQEAMTRIPGVKLGDCEECPLTHRFADNVYVREIFIPKGTLIVGKIHRHSHPNFLMKGTVSVLTEEGGLQKLTAPLAMISPAATKRVVYAHEDTVWVTVHVTDKRSLDEIEEEVISKSYAELTAGEAAEIRGFLEAAK